MIQLTKQFHVPGPITLYPGVYKRTFLGTCIIQSPVAIHLCGRIMFFLNKKDSGIRENRQYLIIYNKNQLK